MKKIISLIAILAVIAVIFTFAACGDNTANDVKDEITTLKDDSEDMMDDKRNRFLHASPTTTAYQLYVASLCWFSERYRQHFPQKVALAEEHATAPATTHAMYHTIADMASIVGRYCDPQSSLVSPDYNHKAPRRYLNDHNEAVPFRETGLTKADIELLKQYGITDL